MATPQAMAVLIVVPNVHETTDGGGSLSGPLGALGEFRYQQLIPSSELGMNPLLLEQIAFRADEAFGSSFGPATRDLEFSLSTTSITALSTNFASNRGADETVVLSDSLSLSGGASGFDIVLAFDTPFLYNPSEGNLLLEIVNSGSGGSGAVSILDAYSPSSLGLPLGLFSQDLSDEVGTPFNNPYVVQFGAQVIPEPGSVAIWSVLGALGLVAAARRRRKRRTSSTRS
jgi:hypothetical protein